MVLELTGRKPNHEDPESQLNDEDVLTYGAMIDDEKNEGEAPSPAEPVEEPNRVGFSQLPGQSLQRTPGMFTQPETDPQWRREGYEFDPRRERSTVH